jgi:hypothetical protein
MPTPRVKTPDDEGLFDRLANRALTVRLLAATCLVLMMLAALGPLATVYLLHEPERVAVAFGDGTVTITRLLRYQEALSWHKLVVNENARALLSRGPAGLDDQDMIELCFNDQAKAKLAELLKNQEPIFREYSYHQKPEIESTEIAADPDGTYRARIMGQLIRTGTYNNSLKGDTLRFTLILYLFRNQNAAINQKYPLGVWNFDYSESR